MDRVNAFKAGLTALVTCLSALWGVTGWMVLAWVVLMVIDWITGSAYAFSSGNWSSSVARQGCWHKGGSMAAVAVAGIMDCALRVASEQAGIGFHYTLILVPITLTWYILTEAGSIIENVGNMGAPLPPFLVKAIQILKNKAEIDIEEEKESDDE